MMNFITKLFSQSSMCSQSRAANTELKQQVRKSLDDSQRRVDEIRHRAVEQRRVAPPTPRINVA